MINIICEVSKYLVFAFHGTLYRQMFFGAIIEKRRARSVKN